MSSTPNLNATHLPFLLACLRRTTGPAIELGMGLFSTPLFHAFAAQGRYCRSVDTNSEWVARMRAFFRGVDTESGTHDLVCTESGQKTPVEDKAWGFAMVDHEQSRRAPDLLRLMNRAELILVHDATMPQFRLEPVLGQFRFRFVTSDAWPATSLVSNFNPVDWISEAIRDLW